MTRKIRILTTSQASELTEYQRRWLRALGYLPAIAGGGPEDDEDDDGGTSGEADDDEFEVIDDDDDSSGGGGEDEDREDSGARVGPDEAVVSKSEFERLKRIAKEAEQKAKKAEREAARRAEQEKREAGNWEELLRERDERIAEIEAEREASRLELDATLRSQRIGGSATRLNFRDPMDAEHFLSEDETQDEASTERALKRLAREKPYLVNERRPSGAPVNGDGPSLTVEEIKRMSPDEINSRWQEVQAVMTAGGHTA